MSVRLIRVVAASAAVLALLLSTVGIAATTAAGDTLVTVGSPSTPFPQNKQNEPGVAVDPANPLIAVAGSNDEIDLGPCSGSSCPFTPGVGVSGVYFSFDGGTSWTQPTYIGYSDRSGTPTASGPIGTLPNYYEAGLVSGGDPELAFGPQPDGQGGFTYANGARLYYANLVSNFPGKQAFKGFEAVAVSYADNLKGAAAGEKSAWSAPVIESAQNSAVFNDKDSIAVDNASSSPYFGHVYVCNVAFRGEEISPNAVPEPVIVGTSTNGGQSYTTRQVSAATNNGQTGGRQGCALATDSHGTVYLVYSGYSKQQNSGVFYEQRSFNGGTTFTRPQVVAVVGTIGQFDAVQGRLTIHGVAGSRTDVFPSLSVANGAPTGADATNEVVLGWADARAGLNREQAYIETSTNGGASFSSPVAASDLSEGRANQAAVSIAPNGSEIYLTYNAYHQAWQSTTADPRMMNGVVREAGVAADGTVGTFTTVVTGTQGDARGSSANNLMTEFLGDYNDVAASDSGAVAVWNDMSRGTDCSEIDAYRQSLVDGSPIAKPAPSTDCPATFGNSDIYGAAVAP